MLVRNRQANRRLVSRQCAEALPVRLRHGTEHRMILGFERGLQLRRIVLQHALGQAVAKLTAPLFGALCR